MADRKIPRRLTLVGNELILAFGFDRDLLDDVRKLGRWDPVGKVWRCPMTKLNAVVLFARTHNFSISSEVEFFDAPPPPVEFERIDVVGRWIHLTFNWDKVRAAEAKKIPGCRFDDDRGCWVAPLQALWDCIEFGRRHNLEVADGLEYRAGLEQKRRDALFRASYLKDFQADGMHPDLDPHQRVAVEYVNLTRRCFIADDIGLGKTFEVIASLDYADSTLPSYPCLVVAPPKLTLNWLKEFAQWSPDRTVQVIGKKADVIGSPDVVIIGWSLLHHHRAELAARGFRAYVLDESHSAKTKGAQRTKAAITVSKGLAPEALRLALSGTPMSIRTAEFVPQLQILGLLDEFGGSTGFERTFCGGGLDSSGRWNTNGVSQEEVLNRWLRGTGYIRRLREDVLDLPDVVHGDVLVTGDLRGYRVAEKDLIRYVMERAAEIAEKLGEDVRSAAVRARLRAEAGKHLVQISALRREAALAKLPAAHEWIGDAVEVGKKVVVAAHHRDVVDALADQWGGLKIQGGQKTADIEAAKKAFQEGSQSEAPVLVLSIQAGKEGHTLTSAQDCLMVEFPWTSTDYDQTWGRLWRRGQTERVFVTAMLLDGTLDVSHFDMLGRRRRRVKAATDGAPVDSGPGQVLRLFDLGLAA